MVAFDAARKRANDRLYMPRGDGYERSKEALLRRWHVVFVDIRECTAE